MALPTCHSLHSFGSKTTWMTLQQGPAHHKLPCYQHVLHARRHPTSRVSRSLDLRPRATVKEEAASQEVTDVLDDVPLNPPKPQRFKPFVAQTDAGRAMAAFRRQVPMEGGQLFIHPLSEQWLSGAADVLTACFSDAMGYLPAYNTYLRNEVYAYLQSHTDLLPKAVVLVGVFRPESLTADDDSSAMLPSTTSSDAHRALSVSGSGEESDIDPPSTLSVSGSRDEFESSASGMRIGTSGAERGCASERTEIDDSARRRGNPSTNGSLAGELAGSDDSAGNDASFHSSAAQLEPQGIQDEYMKDQLLNIGSQASLRDAKGSLGGAPANTMSRSEQSSSESEAPETSTRSEASNSSLPQSTQCSSSKKATSKAELGFDGMGASPETSWQGLNSPVGLPDNRSSGEGSVMDSRDGYSYLSEAENGCERSAERAADDAGFRSGDVLVGTVELSFSPSTRTAALTLNPPASAAYLCNMAVDPNYQRRGFGLQLLEAAEQVVQLSGFRRIYLHLRLKDAPARALYAKAGYNVEKEDCVLIWLLGQDRRQLLSKFIPRARSPFATRDPVDPAQ